MRVSAVSSSPISVSSLKATSSDGWGMDDLDTRRSSAEKTRVSRTDRQS